MIICPLNRVFSLKMSAVVKFTASLPLVPSSSAARCTTHRLCTDTRTRLPREDRALANQLLRRSSAQAANRNAPSPTWGIEQTKNLIGPRYVTSHVRHFGFEVTFGAFNNLFKTKTIIYIFVHFNVSHYSRIHTCDFYH